MYRRASIHGIHAGGRNATHRWRVTPTTGTVKPALTRTAPFRTHWTLRLVVRDAGDGRTDRANARPTCGAGA
jgi:hypothetical protein